MKEKLIKLFEKAIDDITIEKRINLNDEINICESAKEEITQIEKTKYKKLPDILKVNYETIIWGYRFRFPIINRSIKFKESPPICICSLYEEITFEYYWFAYWKNNKIKAAIKEFFKNDILTVSRDYYIKRIKFYIVHGSIFSEITQEEVNSLVQKYDESIKKYDESILDKRLNTYKLEDIKK